MMKKKELLNFLRRVEEKALYSVKAKWDKLLDNRKEELLTIVKMPIENREIRLSNLNICFRGVLEDLEIIEDVPDREDVYGSVEKRLQEINGKSLYQCIKDSCNFADYDKQYMVLAVAKQKEIDETERSYDIVIHNCEKMTSGKQVANYLRELGFDLSSLEKGDTSLVQEVDKSKLFVCGENK